MIALKTKFIAYMLDYHWFFVRKYRTKIILLYEQGVSLTDEKVLSINEKFSHHCIMVARLDRLFLARTASNGK